MGMNRPRVAILMGSKSDLKLMEPASEVLDGLGIPHVVRVLSAHRTPERTREFALGARDAGLQVIICAAGGAAHLAGAVAASTSLPVIGVPLARSSLAGQDSLLATVQMPPGVPVATVGIDSAENAALLAAQILAVSDPAVKVEVEARRKAQTARVTADDEVLLAKQRE
jgi:5-(carboxyamino)imidazole ribonucleotide mutase